MWRAALPCKQHLIALLGLAVAAALAGSAVPSSHPEAAAPGQVWGVAFPAKTTAATPAQLRWLSARGVTTVVAFNAPRASLPKLAAAAAKAKLNVIAPLPRVPRSACRSTRGALRRCAAVTPTAVTAVKLARRSLVDYVVVRVSTPRQLRMLRGSGAKRSRIVAVLPLSGKAAARAAWNVGVAYASADPALDLAVASAPSVSTLLGGYLSSVPRSRTAAAAGPAAPTSLIVVGRTASTVSLRWTAPSGQVSGYGVYTDGTFVLEVGSTAITLTGLQCGRTYSFAVDAYDASGDRSSRTSISSATDTCPGGGGGVGVGGEGGGGGAADTTVPSTPSGFARAASTQTSISVSWSASTDNVGVAGYGLYRGTSLVGTASVTSYSYSGLTCGTTYTLAVDAYDAAGNRSTPRTISASTNACSAGADTTAPSAPGSLTRTASTATSISVSWSASTDNVGVSGYGLYRNGSSTGSTGSTTSTFSGLSCGTSYTLGVDAYDAAGNRSSRTSLTTATSACPPPASDTQAPSVPQGMAFGAITDTTVALAWDVSTDNVAVAGYRLSRNGVAVATVASPGYTYVGLTCGTSYTFTLEAYDAAGNFSNGAEATGSTTTAACAGGGGGGGTPPPPPPPTSPPPPSASANVWVDVSGGTCARQASPGAYSDAQACGSLRAAYNAASAGDTVNIADGTYGGQTLASGTKALTFRAAGPGRPSFGHFVSAAQNITVRGILIADRSDHDGSGACSTAAWGVLTPCGQFQTFENVIVDGLNTGDKHGIESPGRGFTLRNSEIRNIRDMKGFEGGADDMLIEGNTWRNITVTNSDVHNECMFINNGNRSVYRGNLFLGCPTMAMFFTNWNGGPAYRDVVIENNVLGHTLTASGGWHPGPTLLVGSGYNNQNTLFGWIVRYNTFETGVLVDNLPGGGSQWYGNLGGIDCVSAFTYSYNVGQTCGGTGDVPVANAVNTAGSQNQAPFYVNAPAGDFQLKAGSAPIDRADPSRYPATDKDGKTRPVGSRADAGAYEWG